MQGSGRYSERRLCGARILPALRSFIERLRAAGQQHRWVAGDEELLELKRAIDTFAYSLRLVCQTFNVDGSTRDEHVFHLEGVEDFMSLNPHVTFTRTWVLTIGFGDLNLLVEPRGAAWSLTATIPIIDVIAPMGRSERTSLVSPDAPPEVLRVQPSTQLPPNVMAALVAAFERRQLAFVGGDDN